MKAIWSNQKKKVEVVVNIAEIMSLKFQPQQIIYLEC